METRKFSSSKVNQEEYYNLTDDQRRAFDSICEWLANPNEPYLALAGPGGTGKTYLMKFLIENCGIPAGKIGLASPTHKAARVLNESIGKIHNLRSVKTLQSDLGLRLNFNPLVEDFNPNRPQFNPLGRIRISLFSFYIVDEASMIPKGLRGLLEKHAKTHNTKILYVGDPSQLPPVNEHNSSAFSHRTLMLNQIVRQKSTNPLTKILSVLRKDIKQKSINWIKTLCEKPININEEGEGYMLLPAAKFRDKVIEILKDGRIENDIDYAKLTAYTNNTVNAWNDVIRNNIIIDATKATLTNNDLLISCINTVDAFLCPVLKNSEEYIIKDVVNHYYDIKDSKNHIIGSLKGFMCKFVSIHGASSTPPLFVIDHADNPTINLYYRTIMGYEQNKEWKEWKEFKQNVLCLKDIITIDEEGNRKIAIPRSLDYGFAITTHKSQGSTYETIFVDANDILKQTNGQLRPNIAMNNRLAYVALSRARKLAIIAYD